MHLKWILNDSILPTEFFMGTYNLCEMPWSTHYKQFIILFIQSLVYVSPINVLSKILQCTMSTTFIQVTQVSNQVQLAVPINNIELFMNIKAVKQNIILKDRLRCVHLPVNLSSLESIKFKCRLTNSMTTICVHKSPTNAA